MTNTAKSHAYTYYINFVEHSIMTRNNLYHDVLNTLQLH